MGISDKFTQGDIWFWLKRKTRVRANAAANYALTNGAWNLLQYGTKVEDRLGEWNTSTHEFTPNVSGEYHVNVAVTFDAIGAGSIWITSVFSNGAATEVQRVAEAFFAAGLGGFSLIGSATVKLTAGTPYTFRLYAGAAGSTAQANGVFTYLDIERVP